MFYYIHGADKQDASSIQAAFNYTGLTNIKKLKIAYIRNYLDTLADNSTDKQTLKTIQAMGAQLIPIRFPDSLHGNEILSLIIGAEAAAVFDQLTRSSKDDEMVQQNRDRWPNIFRTSQFIPAVDYINACRLRYRIMQKMDPFIDEYDIIIAPPETGDQLALTNLTGNPSVTLPNGFLPGGLPSGITFYWKTFWRSDSARFFESLSGSNRVSTKTPFRLFTIT